MNDFEFLAGFFGVLLGLIIAQVAGKLAEAIDEHRERPVGLLTSLLAAFVLCDVTGFWLWIWSARTVITVSWPSVFLSTALAIIYYLAAALMFPRVAARWASYDEHYWARKRLVLGGILVVNMLTLAGQLARRLPELNDLWFYPYQLGYFLPLIALLFTRRRWHDVALLSWLLLTYVIVGFDLLPSSRWGDEVMLNPRLVTAPASPH
jgi:MFS family permease